VNLHDPPDETDPSSVASHRREHSPLERLRRGLVLGVMAWGIPMTCGTVVASRGFSYWDLGLTCWILGGIVVGMVVGAIGGFLCGSILSSSAGALVLVLGSFPATGVRPHHVPDEEFLIAILAVVIVLGAVLGGAVEGWLRGLPGGWGRWAVAGILALLLVWLVRVGLAVSDRRHRPPPSCLQYLKQIDGAKQQWAIDNKKSDTDIPVMSDLVTTYIKNTPTCPSGGTYTFGAVSADPSCSFKTTNSEHALPL
jgi:hypothetical protein